MPGVCVNSRVYVLDKRVYIKSYEDARGHLFQGYSREEVV